MSVYTVHKLLHRAEVDLDFRERAPVRPAWRDRRDLPLTDDERSALLAGDVAPSLAEECTRSCSRRIPRFGLFGLDRDEYIRTDARPSLTV